MKILEYIIETGIARSGKVSKKGGGGCRLGQQQVCIVTNPSSPVLYNLQSNLSNTDTSLCPFSVRIREVGLYLEV